jgi:mannonate dehydratase
MVGRLRPKLFDAVRNAVGPEIHLLHDVHHRLTPIEAAKLGCVLEPFDLFWMEDPTPAENQAAFRLIRQHIKKSGLRWLKCSTVFGIAKNSSKSNSSITFEPPLFVQAGITHLRRIADLASLYQVRIGSVGVTDLSPVCMGAALHLDTWVPNFGVQQYMPHSEQMHSVLTHDYRFESGFMFCGESPGHGVDINEAMAAKYPYQRAYLPVNRLKTDGTLWNW